MDIQVIAAASVPTPAAGYKTLFIDTSNNNLLTFKNSDGALTLFSDSDGDADCCACVISKDYADGILCALKKGLLAPTDFQALISLGFTVNVTETTDPTTGNTTCNVTMGTNASAVVQPTSVAIIPNITSVVSGTSQQYYAQFTPLNATDQGINWISSDPTKGTVTTGGLFHGVTGGAVTLYAYSHANNSIVGTKTITVG